MNNLRSIPGLLTFLILYSCGTNETETDAPFHGMWSLDKFEAFDSLTNTWADDSTRVGWNGYILYDGLGHMGVHLTPRGYIDFDTSQNIDSLNQDDLKALAKFYKSNFVYFSDYVIVDRTVEHKRLSATEPMNWGKSLTRDFTFKQDTLVLTAKEIIDGQQIRLRWIKLK